MMIYIILFEELENDYKVGFMKEGFAVYGMVSKDSTKGLSQLEIAQRVYEQVKQSMDYESARVAEGKKPSIEVEYLDGEPFTPADPAVGLIRFYNLPNIILFDDSQDAYTLPVSVGAFDQYGDHAQDPVKLAASLGRFEGNDLHIPKLEDVTDLTITASCGGVDYAETIKVYPSVPQPDPNSALRARVDELAAENETLRLMVADLGLMVGGGL